MSYEQKYLKYKQKYLALKEQDIFAQGDSFKSKYIKLKFELEQQSTTLLTGGKKKEESGKGKVVFLLGGPGCGKGTNAIKISKKFGYVHLSAGDLLREEKSNPNSKHGELINSYMKEGKLVPPEIPTQLLKAKMEELQKVNKNKFLIDGFPRSYQNLEFWNNIIGDYVDLQFVLFLECKDDIMIDRALKRGKKSGRVDDNIETLRKRLDTYKKESLPVIEHFRKNGLLEEVNSNRTKKEVFDDIALIFKKYRK